MDLWACCVCKGHCACVRESARKPVGKPDAGNPHVRFDERGLRNGRAIRVSTRARPRLYRHVKFRNYPRYMRRESLDAARQSACATLKVGKASYQLPVRLTAKTTQPAAAQARPTKSLEPNTGNWPSRAFGVAAAWPAAMLPPCCGPHSAPCRNGS